MTEHKKYQPLQEERQTKTDFKRILFRYFRNWPWFLLAVILALAVAYGYNRYTPKVFSANAKIKILDKSESEVNLQGLVGDNSLVSTGSNKLQNEVEIIRSRRILDSVVKNAHLQTLFYKEGPILTIEKWRDKVPIRVQWPKGAKELNSSTLSVEFTTDTNFILRSESDEEFSKKGTLNDTLEIKGHRLIIELNPGYSGNFNNLKGKRYLFKHRSRESAINELKGSLSIDQEIKDSDVLYLYFQGHNRTKNEAILDTLVKEFKLDGLRDKEQASQRSAEFIDKRINLLEEDLDTVEMSLVNYKQESGLVNIQSITGQMTGKESSASKNRFDLQNQKAITEDVKKELTSGEEYELLPANVGIEKSSINKLIDSYNETVSVRKDLLTSSTENNPLVKNAEQKLDRLKENILKSIDGYLRSLNQSLKSYTQREEAASSRLNKLPENEKRLRSIGRQQKIKEELYLFLLKKREEIGLRYAMISPSVKLVDNAYSTGSIAPNTRMAYVIAIILGLFIPFGILYIKFLFYTKIEDRDDIKSALPGIPVLAEIPQLSKKTRKGIAGNDQSVLAEAFRILRTNLGFFKPKDDEHGGQVIFVTSTSKGEGKTFTSSNIAQTLALTDNKILIIGADLRNPRAHSRYNLDEKTTGLSNYLTDSSLEIKDIIHTDLKGFENIDLIASGDIPPNPAEILMRKRFGDLIEEVKTEYDYIVVDTAPTILVTDSLLIAHYADLTLYVIRGDYTDKHLLEHIEDMYEDEKLRHVGIIFNGVTQKSGYSYNYGYGYGYYAGKSAPWWKFWKHSRKN